jgi:hypothetical protein
MDSDRVMAELTAEAKQRKKVRLSCRGLYFLPYHTIYEFKVKFMCLDSKQFKVPEKCLLVQSSAQELLRHYWAAVSRDEKDKMDKIKPALHSCLNRIYDWEGEVDEIMMKEYLSNVKNAILKVTS